MCLSAQRRCVRLLVSASWRLCLSVRVQGREGDENRNDSDDAVFRARDERILVNHNHLSLNLAPPKH